MFTQYYARFFHEVRLRVFRFIKGQVIFGLVVGILTLAASALLNVATNKIVGLSILATIGAYLSALAFFAVFAVFAVPVALDKQRLKEIRVHQLKVEEMEARTRKSPLDREREEYVIQNLTSFNEEERGFLKWLLRHGQRVHSSSYGWSQVSRFAIENAVARARGCQLILNDLEPTPGGVETYIRINPSYLKALEGILLGETTFRPVTPDPS